MKFNWPVFAEQMAILGSPEPSTDDARGTMLGQIQPVIVPGGITRPDVNQVRDSSHLAGSAVTVSNGAATTSSFTTLTKGVWRITGTFQYSSTVTATGAGSNLRLAQGPTPTAIGNLAGIFTNPLVAINGIVAIDVQLSLDTDTVIQLQVGATGAGERTTCSAQIHCQRII